MIIWALRFLSAPATLRRTLRFLAAVYSTLLDTLTVLDSYIRQRVPDYDGSDTAQTVAEMIEKAQARNGRKVKKIIPLSGQMDFVDDFDTDAIE